MSERRPDDAAIRIAGLGKMYKIFPTRLDNFLDALGVAKLLPIRRNRFREFWALRDVDLEVGRGRRVGIVGCNGAGKTTLLKLITGNVAPTEGTVDVTGDVHALMNTGAGFHPEFTGRENIEASLVYQGLSRDQIRDAIGEIAEFTELEEFLDQPFKTYSAGMQARLTFATATTIKPDILIIDEILGAGDGYFIAKSTERIAKLVESDHTTVLIVSHALDMTVRFCEEAIWIDHGRVVRRGEALEVVKAYEQFLRARNERRLQAKNRARQSGNNGGASRFGFYDASLIARFVAGDAPTAGIDIGAVALKEGPEVYEELRVGDAQDSAPNRPASVSLSDACGWGPPSLDGPQRFRSVAGGDATPPADVQFFLWTLDAATRYEVEIRYRTTTTANPVVELLRDGEPFARQDLAPSDDWTTATVSFGGETSASADDSESDGSGDATAEPARAVSEWPGDDTLRIETVTLIDADGTPRASFEAGKPMALRMKVRASRSGRFPALPVAVIYRLDGIPVSRHRGSKYEIEIDEGATQEFQIDFGPLNLGDGDYVFSVGLYRELDAAATDKAAPYQVIDRSYEFEVYGNAPNPVAIFQHPGEWRLL